MPSKDNIFLSIIVPVYNEEDRLEHLEEIYHYFKKQNYQSEIIVVDDGSKDSTLSRLNKFKEKYKLKIVSYQPNHGKGYAIKKGMLVANGKYLLFTDVDLSTPITEIEKFIPHLQSNSVVIGTRKNNDAKVIVHQHFIRENLGKVFTFISQIVLGVKVTDFTCGFKCFPRTAILNIFKKMRIERWGFDSEVIYLAAKHHYKIVEIPVLWKNDFRSKVKFPQDIINSLKELMTIFINDRLYNRYK